MNFTRREALLGSASLSALGLLSSRLPANAAGPWPNPMLIVVRGDPDAVSQDRFSLACRPFHEHGIPLTVSVPVPDIDKVGRNARLDGVRALRKIYDADPSLTEIAIDLGVVETTNPYFQLRQASKAQAAFSFAVNLRKIQEAEVTLSGLTATTVSPVRTHEDFAATRAAGIRSVVHLAGDEAAESEIQPSDGGIWMTKNGLANIFATAELSVMQDSDSELRSAEALGRAIDGAARTSNPLVLHIPLDAMAGLSDADLSIYVGRLADMVATARDKDTIRCLLPNVMYRQNRPDDARYVVVRVDDYRVDTVRRPRHEAFVESLTRRDVPVTEAVIPGGWQLLQDDEPAHAYLKKQLSRPGFEAALHGWKHSESEFEGRTYDEYLDDLINGAKQMADATGRVPTTFIPPNNVMDDSALDAQAAIGMPVFSSQKGNYRWYSGLDHRGLLHVSNIVGPEKSWEGDYPYFSADELVEQIGPDNDAVLMLHPNTMESPAHLGTALRTIDKLADQPGTVLTTFEDYRKLVMPPIPALDLIQSARSMVTVLDGPHQAATDDEAQLKRDAERAWSFFDWAAGKFNGMAPATGWSEYGKFEGYPYVTMWDIGSLILGTISAHKLGIIDQSRFETGIQRVVEFLGESFFVYKGSRLPENERNVRGGQPTRRGFDSADTGRLLIALSVLDAYSNRSFPLKELVGKWDLAVALPNGEVHDIKGGGPSSLHFNSYSSYARRGYLAWGYDVNEVFDETDLGKDMDSTMRFVEELQRRGRIATEPNTSEEIELGASARTQIVLDLLQAAQTKRFESTGILTCASEGPIDGDPFFTYQGFQLDETGGQWVVDAAHPQKIDVTARRGDAARLVSTKGCFLWSATRPGAYSDRLLDAARTKGLVDGPGFASGIYEATGQAAQLTDINTNGIILEAIAFILNGREPLVGMSANA